MPQPYKGERTRLITRVPSDRIPTLEKVLKVTGERKSDFLARILDDYLSSAEAEELLREAPQLRISA